MSVTHLEPQNDHDLLLGSVEELKAENRAAAARSDRMLVFFRRHEAPERKQDPDDALALSARHRTEIEISELWAVSAWSVRRHLNNALWIDEHFGYLQELALAGSIDTSRTSLIAETARNGLDTDAEYAALARRMTRYLDRHRRADGIITCTPRQLRNKLAYEVRVIRPSDAEKQFQNAHAHRDVQTSPGEHGVSWLTIGGTSDQIQLADHRLTLSARALRAAGDPRTITQLRADLALDLLTTGEVPGTTTIPAFARPIINVTAPLQTVMGLSDHPGRLSGGQVIPAGLARMIAQSPGATWHRMLTDPVGHAVEVSTTSYQPTRAIWEQVVAAEPTCFRAACDRASTTADLDHRLRWPEGPTMASNLWAACRTDHRAKHSPGFAIEQTRSGGFALRTPARFLHAVVPAEHPTDDDWTHVPEEIQFSATEMHEALQLLRERDAAGRPPRYDLCWEYNLNFSVIAEAV